jgi:sodium-dependent dicarboxylate transporter 2/3/5
MIHPTEARIQAVLRRIGWWLGPALFFALLLFFEPIVDKPQAGAMAAVAALMAVWWLSEAVPLAATSLLPIVLFPLFGIADPGRTTGQYFNPIITLFLGGFLIALAMERWCLHRRIALVVLTCIGGRPDRLVLGFLVASAFLSMWISNTATATMMMPIALAVTLRTRENLSPYADRRLGAAIMLAVAYGATTGGMATLVGTPTNMALVQIFQDTFPAAPPIAFGQWLIFALPYALTMLAIVWVVLAKWLFRVDRSEGLPETIVAQERTSLGRMSREEKIILTVFVSAALCWTFRADLKLGGFTLPGWARLAEPLARLEDGTIAIFFALLLFLTPARRAAGEERKFLLDAAVFSRVPWDILLLFGGGFALAMGFTQTGLSQWMAQAFAAVENLPLWMTVGLVALAITFLSELTSNTATAQMFLPVLAAWAAAHAIHPLALMVPATLSASMAFMLPVGTPPNAIVFSTGRVTIVEMARVGFVLNLIGVILTILFCKFWLPVTFNLDPVSAPAWPSP